MVCPCTFPYLWTRTDILMDTGNFIWGLTECTGDKHYKCITRWKISFETLTHFRHSRAAPSQLKIWNANSTTSDQIRAGDQDVVREYFLWWRRPSRPREEREERAGQSQNSPTFSVVCRTPTVGGRYAALQKHFTQSCYKMRMKGDQ